MCTNFENFANPAVVLDLFKSSGVNLSEENKNEVKQDSIRPTNKILTILRQNDEYRLAYTNWGIKFNNKPPLILNSRIETINDKPFWKNLFNKKRALLPMTAFFEWKPGGKTKTRYRIHLPDEDFFFVPALYIEQNNELFTSLVTVPNNEFMKNIHNRMPAIIRKQDAIKIIEAEMDAALQMCKPYKGKMEAAPVISQ
jgi:putative SOS response-associated peptidase YedK